MRHLTDRGTKAAQQNQLYSPSNACSRRQAIRIDHHIYVWYMACFCCMVRRRVRL